MHLSVPCVLVSLLCAVLCGAQNSTTPAPNNTTEMVTNSTSIPIITGNSTNPTNPTNPTNATNPTNPTTATNPTVEATSPSSGGLSDGAIAGITIGSIAGVGALGGGMYGLLKYTGKI